jgi:AAA15 family ATPase/GTPase
MDGTGIKGTGVIQEFSIENTYSIKTRQTISFEAADDTDDIHCVDMGGKKLLKLAAIYGANASGKSNIIKAFDFYINFILNSFGSLKPHAPIPFTPFMFDGNYRDKPGYFEIIFYFENMRYVYTIEVDTHFVHNESLASEHDNIREMLFYRYFEKFHDSKIEYKWFQEKNLSGDI